jgi:hypothetical protein
MRFSLTANAREGLLIANILPKAVEGCGRRRQLTQLAKIHPLLNKSTPTPIYVFPMQVPPTSNLSHNRFIMFPHLLSAFLSTMLSGFPVAFLAYIHL